MDDLRFALIIAGIALIAVVYFVTSRGRRREMQAGEFDPSGAWSDSDADPLLDDLEVTAINPLASREDKAPPQEAEIITATAGPETQASEAEVGADSVATTSKVEQSSEAQPQVQIEDRVLPGIDALTQTLDDTREPHMGSLDALDEPPSSPPPVKKKRAAVKKKTATRKKSSGKNASTKPPAYSGQYEAPADVEPLAIVINIMAQEGSLFPGVDVEESLQEAGLSFGEMELYHYRTETQPEGTLPIFTALNMVKPGTLSPGEFPEMKTPGIALVLRLPGVEEPARAFELMYKACRSISDYLGGSLCDETRSHLTPQALNHLREQITEYSRKLRISSS